MERALTVCGCDKARGPDDFNCLLAQCWVEFNF